MKQVRRWLRLPVRLGAALAGRLTGRRLLAGAAVALLGLVGAFVASLHRGLEVRAPSRVLLDRQGRYLGEEPAADEELGYWPLPDVLPARLVTATLEIEDRYFYDHRGVRGRSLLRAAWQNVSSGHVVSGASTVAMQVARLQSPGRRNVWHKAREAVEALLLVHDQGHDRVLRQYLTIAPYGNNVRGAARASRLYFGKPVEDLSWLEAAFLASLPQSPARMNPYDPAGFARARRRATRIVQVLHQRGFISDVELQQALGGTLEILPKPHRSPAALHAVIAWGGYGREHGPMSTATLDLGIQETTARLLDRNLARLAGTGAGNTAAMVVELPSGNVLAYVGSRDYGAQDTRGAIDYVQTKRSPGSALKPFIYALGLERGRYTAASELPDVPVELVTGPARAWLPENFDRTFEGPLLLRTALGNSRNIPALLVLEDVGLDSVLQMMERGGVQGISFESGRYGLALAIGALPVTLEEIVRLYGVLATGGETFPLRHFQSEPEAPRARLIDRNATAVVTDILSDSMARRPAFPAGGPLDFEQYAVAVKTGTSQGNRDAWAIGYSDRLLVAVWVGNHDARRMERVTGASAAGSALHEIMDAVMPLVSPHRPPPVTFPRPDAFAIASICPLSGRLAGPHCPSYRHEIFIPGTEPIASCPFHARVAIDRRNHLRAGAGCPKRFVEHRVMLDLPETYASWARERHLEIAPRRPSPLCGPVADGPIRVTITEPRSASRFLYDPDTPADSSALALSASVEPPGEELVWEVDGVPVARVSYPYSVRQSLGPGRHIIVARLARRSEASRPVVIDVVN